MKSVYTYEFKLLSALYKVFPEEEPQEDFSVPLTALQNETVSFQAAYKIPSPGEGCLRVAVESPISGRVRLRTVELAPSRFPGDPSWNDGNYSHLRPGLFRIFCARWAKMGCWAARRASGARSGWM